MIQVDKIEFLDSENPDFYHVIVGSWDLADGIARRLARSAPKRGYHKTSFKVTWKDKTTIEGNIDLKHLHQNVWNVIGKEVMEQARFYSGQYKPEWITETTYQTILSDLPDDLKKLMGKISRDYDLGVV